MGGGHHDFGERYKIPDYRIYKVEDCPKLLELQKLLAAKGLKDPWIRNEAWRFNGQFAEKGTLMKNFFFPGFKYGFAAFLLTIGIDAALKLSKKGDEGYGHH